VGERTRPLLLWVGSGLSLSAGLPSWHQLKKTLVDTLVGKARTIETREQQRLLSVAEQVRKQPDYWTSFQILHDNLGRATYRETVREAFREASACRIPKAYLAMWQLPVRG